MTDVSVIGCGHMGSALVKGLSRTGTHRVTACDLDTDALEAVEPYCSQTTTDTAVAATAEVVFVAVKPQAIEAVLTDLDLPLVLHHAADGNRFEPNARSMRTFVEWTWVMPCTQAIQNTANMVMTGVFDEFPDLNVVYQEAGTNWLPFLAFRLDEVYPDHTGDVMYTRRAFEADREYLERKPSEVIFENFYTCSQVFCKPDSPKDFRQTLDLTRAGDSLLYSSDFPHYTFDPPSWLSRVLPEEIREAVLHENAREVFRI